MSLYKDEYTDFIMAHNSTLPRYGRLARKALSHYLGDKYNPETLDTQIEMDLRSFIYTCVQIKVMNKIPYDWNFIDNMFKIHLYGAGFDISSFDEEVIKNGYHGGKYGIVSHA